jgi:hypothetical protein
VIMNATGFAVAYVPKKCPVRRRLRQATQIV